MSCVLLVREEEGDCTKSEETDAYSRHRQLRHEVLLILLGQSETRYMHPLLVSHHSARRVFHLLLSEWLQAGMKLSVALQLAARAVAGLWGFHVKRCKLPSFWAAMRDCLLSWKLLLSTVTITATVTVVRA